MKKLLFQIVLVSSISLLCFSCYYDEIPDHLLNPPELPTDPDDPDYVEISFSNDVQVIFNANCIGCHNNNQDPDLREGNSYNALVPNYVTAEDADNSAIYNKVLGGHGNLNTTQLQTLKGWINQGAENN